MDESRALVTRFRHPPGFGVAGLIVTISTVSLAGFSAYYAFLVALPAAYTIWAWRAGTDADHTGLRVRALFGQRRVPWSEVTGLAPDGRGRAVAMLVDGMTLPLTAVKAADLPRLVAASGRELG